MAAVMANERLEQTTTAALVEKAKLRRHLGRFDMLFFLLCSVVGLDTLGTVANNGGQAFTWLAFVALFFFLPYGLVTAELGSTFPEEGGAYVWTKLAFGRPAAAINAVLYWLSNPIWLGGSLTITAVATFGVFVTPLHGTGQYLFSLAFIWLAVWSAILSLSVGKWIPTFGAWVRIAVLAGFTVTVVIYALSHGVHGVGAGDFKPTYAIFIAAVPVLILNYVGFELPNAAAEEMEDAQRDVPVTVLRAGLGAAACYAVPILAVLLVLPTKQITSLGGFIDAMKTVFTVYGGDVKSASDGTVTATLSGAGRVLGDVMAIGFIVALFTGGATWIMGADRCQAVAGFDGAAPRVLGRFSARWGTPVVVNLVSGIVATIVMVLAFRLTGNANKYFSAVLGLALSTTVISYLLIFPALVKLRYTHPHVPRPYRVPGGAMGAWLCSILCTLWAAVATVVLLYPGLGTGDPDASLPDGWAHQRAGYELTQIAPLVAILALGVLFYLAGAPTRRRQATLPLAPPGSQPSAAS